MVQFFGFAAIVNGVEQRFLLIVELGQQIGVGHREQRTLEDAVVAAELLYPFRIDGECTKQAGFFQHGLFAVGE